MSDAAERVGGRPFPWVRAPMLACAVAAIGLFLWVALARLGFDFDVEWLEGAGVDTVQRVLDGKPLYVAPSVEYVPLLYTPAYYWVCAPLALVFGNGYVPLRLVSLAATLGTLAFLFALVRRWSGHARAGFLAAGFYAACFGIGGAWMDLARVDSLAIFFWVAGLWLLTRRGVGAEVLAGLALALAVFTKQTLAVCVAATLAGALLQRNPRRWIAVGTAAGAIALGTFALERASDGWFSFYVSEVPRSHEWQFIRLRWFWTEDLLPVVPVALVATAYALVRRGPERVPVWFAGSLLGGIVSASLARAHRGGIENVLLPCLVMLAIGFGLGLAAFETRVAALADRPRRIALALAVVLVVAQFARLAYDPRPLIPNARDEAAGRAWLAKLASIEGEVLVRSHGFFAPRAGKPATLHNVAGFDVLRGPQDRGRPFYRFLEDTIASRRFAAIVVDPGPLPRQLEANYRQIESPNPDPDALWTRVGVRTRPETLWVRRTP
jgi:dolichyl-phosphate-mannose-protein mannosyltransferase